MGTLPPDLAAKLDRLHWHKGRFNSYVLAGRHPELADAVRLNGEVCRDRNHHKVWLAAYARFIYAVVDGFVNRYDLAGWHRLVVLLGLIPDPEARWEATK